MSNKSVGDFGECITALLLEKKYAEQRLSVVRVGADNLPYDLIIPFPVVGTPFEKPTLISVKTRGEWWGLIPIPQREGEVRVREMEQFGFDFWIAFVKYAFKEDQLQFGVYLLPSGKLDLAKDFKRVTRRGKVEKQIIAKNFIEKSELKFNSALSSGQSA